MRKVEQNQEYSLMFHLSEMPDCRQQMYEYKKQTSTTFKSQYFQGSLTKFPKYYCFYEVVFYTTNRKEVVLLKKKNLQEQVTEKQIQALYLKRSQVSSYSKLKIKFGAIAILKIDKDKNKQSNKIIISVMLNQLTKCTLPTIDGPYHVVRFFKDGFHLKQNQIIKVGKIKLRVRKIKIDNQKQQLEFNIREVTECTDINNQIKLQRWNKSSPKSQSQTNSESQERGCKICLSNQQSDGILIKPCKCEQPIHISCLQKWMQIKLQNRKNQQETDNRVNHLNFDNLNCQICRGQLPRIFVLQKHIYQLVDFDVNNFEAPYVIFQKVQSQRYQIKEVIGIQNLNDPVNMGRYEQNGISIQDPSISRSHCSYVKDSFQNKIKVSDKQSKFGTLVKVNSQNNAIQLQKSFRRGFQIDRFLLVAQIQKKKFNRN